MKYLKNIAMLFAALVAMTVVTSCTTDDTDAGANDRLFRPVNIDATASGNTITVTWAGIEGATGYTAELYRRDVVTLPDENDPDEEIKYEDKILVARDENIQGTSWTVPGLLYDTQYYVRLKSNHANQALNSHFSDFKSVKTQQETQVLRVTIDDPRNGDITFTWMAGYALTYIELYSADGDVKTYSINDNEGRMQLFGLDAGNYTAVAGNSSRSYNVVSFLIPVLYDVEAADITTSGITLYWAADPNISTLSVVNAADKTDALEYDAPVNGSFTIPTADLGFEQTYNATLIYADGSTTNTIRFTTLAEMPADAIFVSTYEEMKEAVAAAADGATIAINPGEYHIMNNDGDAYASFAISKGITLRAATAVMPTLIFKQLFQITATSEIELVRVDGIELVGFDEFQSGSDSYLIDMQATSTASINRIEIEHCRIHGIANSLVRADRATGFNAMNIFINDNVMWNMNGKQCYIATYIDGSIASESIIFTNNTVTGLSKKNANQRAFAYMAGANFTMKISNNTFYDCTSGTSPFIHARGSADGSWGKVEVKDNIFYYKPADETNYNNAAPNFGEGSSPSISGNVLPFAWATYNADKDPKLSVKDWSEYGAITTNPEFADPENLDFTVTNDAVRNLGAGDPRWLK